MASFVKTIGADTQTTTYLYNPTNQRLERYTNVFSDGSSSITNILYDVNGKVIGVENSGSVSDVTETLNDFTIIQSGDPVSFRFNAEEQLTSIQYPTVNFDVNPSIKRSLHEVEVDKVFYLSVLEIIYLTKQGLNNVDNYFFPELHFSNTVDASGYLLPQL